MLQADLMEKVENEIVALRDSKIERFCNIASLNDSRKNLIQGGFNISFAWIIYRMIQAINLDLSMLYKDKNYKHITYFFNLYQWQWDDIFEICIKANRIGLEVYPKINPNNDLSYLNEVEITKLLEVYEEAINKYFDVFLEVNKRYLTDERTFIHKMTTFGDNHILTEAELVNFATKAYEKGINVADINTQEELEDICKLVCPEA